MPTRTLNDLEITSNWLDKAASINANDGSEKSEFVKEATKSAGEQVGKLISDVDFLKVSDDLAKDVLSDINGMMKSLEERTASKYFVTYGASVRTWKEKLAVNDTAFGIWSVR